MNMLYVYPAYRLKLAQCISPARPMHHFPNHCHERTSGMSIFDSIENWKPIPGDDLYQVSDLGNVRNRKSGLVLSPWVTRHGYAQVNIKGRNRVYIHRIVAQVWCIGYEPDLQVNHKDGVKTNNHPSNLEWVTSRQNQSHRFSVLNHKGVSLGKFGGDHSASKAVISTHLVTGEIRYYPSAMDAVREGFTSSQISRVCRGKNNKHKGYSWAYAMVANEAEFVDAETGEILEAA